MSFSSRIQALDQQSINILYARMNIVEISQYSKV